MRRAPISRVLTALARIVVPALTLAVSACQRDSPDADPAPLPEPAAGQLLAPATRELAWTPTVGAGGTPLPYGLGWFVKDVAGGRVVWHYGYWTGNSSLIIVVPARELVFVALANSDQLSAPFRLGSGDLLSSPLAQAFVNGFVTGTLGG